MMTRGVNDRPAWLLAAVGVAVWAAVSHYLVGILKPGVWLDWFYLLQHAGTNLVLGAVFGRSLLPGRTPLVTVFAGLLHEVMTPLLLAYTRRVTQAWTAFFAVMAALSLLLFFLVPIEAWSLFANILTWPLVVLGFVAENEVRKRVLPPEDQFGIFAAVRAFRAGMKL